MPVLLGSFGTIRIMRNADGSATVTGVGTQHGLTRGRTFGEFAQERFFLALDEVLEFTDHTVVLPRLVRIVEAVEDFLNGVEP